MRLIWLGHGSWRLEIEDAVILIDPWLQGNPAFPDERREEALQGATHILMTHGHGDHASEIIGIANELNLPVAGMVELMNIFGAKGLECTGFNKGGTIDMGGAKVTMVAAAHSSSFDAGREIAVYSGGEVGFMIEGDGKTIYFSGDTDIMADMDWMGDLHKPDIGILSVGGHFTMDPARAAYAAKRWFNFDTIVCSHYRTFDLLKPDMAPLQALDCKLIEPEVMVPFTP